MDQIAFLGLLLGSSWTSGINLYLTAAGLGVAHRFGWVTLPGELELLGNVLIIALALILYVIEFVADKVPYVDSAWDAVHTAVRPVGGALLGYFAMSEAGPLLQTGTALLTGSLALDAHLAKASSRVALNASPEPVSNFVASTSEDVVVVSSLWLMITHPLVMIGIVVIFILLSIWLLPKMFRLFKKAFSFLFGQGKQEVPAVEETGNGK